MAATRIRLHYPDGRVVTQTLTALAKANGLRTRRETLDLIARWQRERAIVRRSDGGYDVKHRRAPKHPSPIRGGLLTSAIGGILSGE